MIVAELAEHVGEVADGCGIDHADPQLAGPTGAGALRPVGEIAGEGDDLSGVGEHRFGGRAQRASATLPIEQWHTDAAFEFAQSLRERGGRHADPGCGIGPGRFGGHGHEIVELANGEVGEGRRHPCRIVQSYFTTSDSC